MACENLAIYIFSGAEKNSLDLKQLVFGVYLIGYERGFISSGLVNFLLLPTLVEEAVNALLEEKAVVTRKYYKTRL